MAAARALADAPAVAFDMQMELRHATTPRCLGDRAGFRQETVKRACRNLGRTDLRSRQGMGEAKRRLSPELGDKAQLVSQFPACDV
jgi:hypothetical protein